jgi:hypothetical protein
VPPAPNRGVGDTPQGRIPWTAHRTTAHATTPCAARSHEQEAVLRLHHVFVTAVMALVLAAPSFGAAMTPKQYAKTLATSRYGWNGAQQEALDALVEPESGWNPCRRYPSTTDCNYAGSSSCGIPQATPCPVAWRGRLDESWREQVSWLLSYIERRYHDPVSALAFRRSYNWY